MPIGAQGAALALAVTLACSSPAQAQIFWSNNFYGAPNTYDAPDVYDEPMWPAIREPARRARPTRPQHHKTTTPAKAVAKPQGPIVIVISIRQQKLKIYDANGLFAESPVSTGKRSHATPMGAFSIIQKNKWHRSNIYSGAPMPYMQRLTWSGIALHAGALPGYPASHGCIRMPTSFALRMWGWTKMGARVVVVPDDVKPVDISHPLLVSHKPEPVLVSADAATIKDQNPVPAARSTVGLAGGAPDMRDLRRSLAADGAGPIRTADAGDTIPHAVKNDAGKVAAGTNTVASSQNTDPSAPDVAQADKPADEKPAADNPPAKRTGHVAAYISGKDGKLYVRQRFEPLFEAPVTITPGDHPLGTHIFTMRADKADPQSYHWSVISLPTGAHARSAARRHKGAASTTHTSTAHMTAEPASSPTEALDRIRIPDEAMQRLAEIIRPGGSLIVSDQGLSSETGRGTDFIVPLR